MRAYCELKLCEGTDVLISRRPRTVHRVVEDSVKDIAKVSRDANITWVEDAGDQLQENVRELLKEDKGRLAATKRCTTKSLVGYFSHATFSHMSFPTPSADK